LTVSLSAFIEHPEGGEGLSELIGIVDQLMEEN
jgi:hypothetical protein